MILERKQRLAAQPSRDPTLDDLVGIGLAARATDFQLCRHFATASIASAWRGSADRREADEVGALRSPREGAAGLGERTVAWEVVGIKTTL